jgi:hypothetical protein
LNATNPQSARARISHQAEGFFNKKPRKIISSRVGRKFISTHLSMLRMEVVMLLLIVLVVLIFGFGYGGYRMGPGVGYYGGGGVSLILTIVLILMLIKVI